MTTTTTTLFAVVGNYDQVQKNNLDKDFDWIKDERMPNRVKTMLPIEEAKELHAKMKELNMVALRTWIID